MAPPARANPRSLKPCWIISADVENAPLFMIKAVIWSVSFINRNEIDCSIHWMRVVLTGIFGKSVGIKPILIIWLQHSFQWQQLPRIPFGSMPPGLFFPLLHFGCDKKKILGFYRYYVLC